MQRAFAECLPLGVCQLPGSQKPICVHLCTTGKPTAYHYGLYPAIHERNPVSSGKYCEAITMSEYSKTDGMIVIHLQFYTTYSMATSAIITLVANSVPIETNRPLARPASGVCRRRRIQSTRRNLRQQTGGVFNRRRHVAA
jgi:hypothetical protein